MNLLKNAVPQGLESVTIIWRITGFLVLVYSTFLASHWAWKNLPLWTNFILFGLVLFLSGLLLALDLRRARHDLSTDFRAVLHFIGVGLFFGMLAHLVPSMPIMAFGQHNHYLTLLLLWLVIQMSWLGFMRRPWPALGTFITGLIYLLLTSQALAMPPVLFTSPWCLVWLYIANVAFTERDLAQQVLEKGIRFSTWLLLSAPLTTYLAHSNWALLIVTLVTLILVSLSWHPIDKKITAVGLFITATFLWQMDSLAPLAREIALGIIAIGLAVTVFPIERKRYFIAGLFIFAMLLHVPMVSAYLGFSILSVIALLDALTTPLGMILLLLFAILLWQLPTKAFQTIAQGLYWPVVMIGLPLSMSDLVTHEWIAPNIPTQFITIAAIILLTLLPGYERAYVSMQNRVIACLLLVLLVVIFPLLGPCLLPLIGARVLPPYTRPWSLVASIGLLVLQQSSTFLDPQVVTSPLVCGVFNDYPILLLTCTGIATLIVGQCYQLRTELPPTSYIFQEQYSPLRTTLVFGWFVLLTLLLSSLTFVLLDF